MNGPRHVHWHLSASVEISGASLHWFLGRVEGREAGKGEVGGGRVSGEASRDEGGEGVKKEGERMGGME